MYWDSDRSLTKNLADFASDVSSSLSSLPQIVNALTTLNSGVSSTALHAISADIKSLRTTFDEISSTLLGIHKVAGDVIEKSVKVEALEVLREENSKLAADMSALIRKNNELSQRLIEYESTCLGCAKKIGERHAEGCEWDRRVASGEAKAAV